MGEGRSSGGWGLGLRKINEAAREERSPIKRNGERKVNDNSNDKNNYNNCDNNDDNDGIV